jgi:hypothetical protein
LLVAQTGAHDHIQLVLDQQIDEHRCGCRVGGGVAVHHHEDVRVDIREHTPHDVAFALQRNGDDLDSGFARDFGGVVCRVVVENDNVRFRQAFAEVAYDGADCSGLVVARNHYSDSSNGGVDHILGNAFQVASCRGRRPPVDGDERCRKASPFV